MPNVIQTLRSQTPGAQPGLNSRQYGELWVNLADNQLGIINSAQIAQPLLAVRNFSTLSSYPVGAFVVQAGALYVAIAAVAPGAFNPAQWNAVATLANVPVASTTPPLMDGTAAVGTATTWSRADHVHPSDTSRYAATNPSGYQTAAQVTAALPPASTTLPLPSGAAAVGTGTTYARADHVHPTPAILPNRIDNGDMWVDQHNNGASIAVPNNGGVYCPDRWGSITNGSGVGSKFTVGQNYPAAITPKPPGFQYFLGVQSSSAYTSAVAALLYVAQNIEADAIGDLGFGAVGAQSITLSFWARSSLTGNFSFAIQSIGATPRTYVTTYSLPTANTWTKIVLIIPGDVAGGATNWPNVGSGVGMEVVFDIGSGANVQTATLNAWQAATAFAATGAVHVTATANANWAITGVKLEAGSVATPWFTEDLARRMARCQRYYQFSQPIVGGYAGAGGFPSGGWALPVPMRAAPTATMSAITYSNGSALTANAMFPTTANFYMTVTAAGTGSAAFNLGLSAEI